MNIKTENEEITEGTDPVVEVESNEGTEGADPVVETIDPIEPVVESKPKPEAQKRAKEEVVVPEVHQREKKIFQGKLDIFILDDENRDVQWDLVKEYARTIPTKGVEKPLLTKAVKQEDGTNKYLIIDGQHRILACREVEKNGESYGWIPFTVDNSINNETRQILMLRRNTGASMSTYDEAKCYKKLIDFGWTREEIAKESGKTTSHISQVLPLTSVPKKAEKMLKNGQISSTLLLHVLARHNDDWELVMPILEELVSNKTAKKEEAEASGQATGKLAGKVTAKDLAAVIDMPPKVTRIHKRLDKAIEIITANEAIDNQQRKAQIKLTKQVREIMDLFESDPDKALTTMLRKLQLV